jgi:hypothetical protein
MPGDDVSFGDTARTFKANIEQLFAGYPSRDGAPLAAADVSGIDLQALCVRAREACLEFIPRASILFNSCVSRLYFISLFSESERHGERVWFARAPRARTCVP